jgi:hypothetical protein
MVAVPYLFNVLEALSALIKLLRWDTAVKISCNSNQLSSNMNLNLVELSGLFWVFNCAAASKRAFMVICRNLLKS